MSRAPPSLVDVGGGGSQRALPPRPVARPPPSLAGLDIEAPSRAATPPRASGDGGTRMAPPSLEALGDLPPVAAAAPVRGRPVTPPRTSAVAPAPALGQDKLPPPPRADDLPPPRLADDIDLAPPALASTQISVGDFPGIPDPGGTMGKALVVIGHRPAMANPTGQIPIRTREVVDVVEYKKAPGGMADDEWWNSVDSQWWIIRSKEGLVGRVPMTSLELIEEAGKTTQELGSGYVAGDSAKTGQDAQKSWVMSNSEWNIGTCARLAKVFRDLKYNEWSKWAQLFAVYVVILECVCIFVWEYNESDRIDELNANQSFLHHGHNSVNFSTALLAAIAGKCTLPNAGENITSSSCDWVVDGDGEIETINLGVAAGSVGIYLLFIVFERSFGPPKADLQGREGMRNATKHPGPVRACVCTGRDQAAALPTRTAAHELGSMHD
jgi:hypothetical protein